MALGYEKPKNAAAKLIGLTLVLSFAYAILRYHIVGPVPWKDLPFYIFNKGIAMAGFILLTFNFSFGPMKKIRIQVPASWLNARKSLGMTGFLLIVIHVLMSFLLFRPAVYAVFFEQDTSLSLQGGLSMLGGVLAFVVLWVYNLSFQTLLREDEAFIRFMTSRRLMLAALFFGGVHLFFMGYKGWVDPSGWQGGLPPISLISFAFFTAGYMINLLGRE